MAEPLTFGGRNHNNMEDLPMGQTAVEDFPCRHGTGRWYWQAGERAGRQALCVSAFCALRRSGWLCIDCVLRLFAGSQAEINGWLFSCSAPSHVYFQDVHTSGRFANQWLRTAILVFQSRMPQERLQDVIIIFRSMYEKRFFGGLLIHFFFIFFPFFKGFEKLPFRSWINISTKGCSFSYSVLQRYPDARWRWRMIEKQKSSKSVGSRFGFVDRFR